MITGGMLNYKYGWELAMFNKIRTTKDGISFINFDIDLDIYEADHKPSFRLFFMMFNYAIIELSIYNVNHADSSYDEGEDNFGC